MEENCVETFEAQGTAPEATRAGSLTNNNIHQLHQLHQHTETKREPETPADKDPYTKTEKEETDKAGRQEEKNHTRKEEVNIAGTDNEEQDRQNMKYTDKIHTTEAGEGTEDGPRPDIDGTDYS